MEEISGDRNGEFWGVRAKQWAHFQEGHFRPLYKHIFDIIDVGPGTRLLDVGCGSGGACQMAADLGAVITGLDASQEMIKLAQERVPNGKFLTGELEQLPFRDGAFDAVTGFNSYQFASNELNALKEAHRVTGDGGWFTFAMWSPLGSDHMSLQREVRSHFQMLSQPQTAPAPTQPDETESRLRRFLSDIGFTVLEVADFECAFMYEDVEAAVKAFTSTGTAEEAIRIVGDQAYTEAYTRVLMLLAEQSGSVVLRNKFRYAVSKKK
jgi:ubiquinone/menaquinone biosynthesis C-methylase UbiE